MQFITGKHMPRRTFVRGMGVAVALPYLEAMRQADTSAFSASTPSSRRTSEAGLGLLNR